MTLTKSAEVSFTGHSKVIQDIGWSCDGKRIATASGDTSARVWTVDTHREGRELELKDHTQSVEGVSWHPKQAETLASISTDKNIRIWDIRTKKSVHITTPEEIINVSYSPSGNHIAVSDKNETVRLLDCRKNKIIATYALPASFWVNELVWTRSGEALLLANGRQSSLEKGLVDVVKVDTTAGELTPVHSMVSAAANCMCISIEASNRFFATGSYDGISTIWDMADLTCVRPCCTSLEEPIGSLAFSHDGLYIAGSCDIEPRNTSARKLIDVSEVATGETAAKVESKAIPRKLAWHPSQHILAFGCEKHVVQSENDRYDSQRGGG
eukprot:CAMPEP_0173393670 /NCGR_PEP_ID=MMETSP1356-20130122/22245_1 /TAXON_ID=77927 ORGANISM="Hemiselmis virescens, Strain PCC157" /NCGR_SAMPLE_ID=MMETSP1356 /ASSEMBLY_ACC=CAM_ASM_000847 /LENGTH=325 /DNA_ID=CAMNT_0014351727 /DNA_START=60 /DNA_END=1033 /DNA_ORIENTATION=+